ncbi:glycerophosphodiester phosphodiesterase [Novosphingopyxis sp.]|uniref:glycerophosphodiester phosphodiesterase n=1 Tax=Novosphingopyxis sp. TaxID=2709690 RepID=UPI003B5BFB1F
MAEYAGGGKLKWTAIIGSIMAALALGACATVQKSAPAGPRAMADFTIIAHRGASGDRPEHTIAAYQLAIDQGADFIEPDLVLTKDGVLVARHENAISETTDVAGHPEFADRRTTKTIDGAALTDWFTEDFTLAELKTLRARERLPQLRPANAQYDGRFEIPTFDEIIALAKSEGARRGRVVGIYPETKHPGYFASIGLPHQAPLLAALGAAGWNGAEAPVFVQSFEVGNLKALDAASDVRLVQLVQEEGGPADLPDISYANMLTAGGVRAIASYADAIGPQKSLVIPIGENGQLDEPTKLVEWAHEAGLLVHPWTFRAENYFLPGDLRREDSSIARGDLAGEIRAFIAAGIDGLFADQPGLAIEALRGAEAE